jgi:uncharacterized membrane-anchored protein YitT (DUF2179 family)
MTDPAHHNLIEDAQGLAFGVFMAAVAVHILTFMGFVAGQSAGVAALLSYATGYSFSLIYMVISLPFIALAYFRMGRRFALKTVMAVIGLSTVTALLPKALVFQSINPATAAILYGGMIGMATLATVRHGGSFGGISVLWLWVQDRWGFPAGYSQLIFDAALFCVAAFVIAPEKLMWSFLGAVVFNLFLAINHRRDRYITS